MKLAWDKVAKAAAMNPFKLWTGCPNQFLKDGLVILGAVAMDVTHEALGQSDAL